MKTCKTRLTMLLVTVILLTGCGVNNQSPQATQKTSQTHSQTANLRSAWMAYWDTEKIDTELVKMTGLNELCVFGVYYDAQGNFIIPDELETLKSKLNDQKKLTKYISFVNDVIKSDGTSSLKDVDFLRMVLADEKSRKQHENKLIKYALDEGYQGIEVDYEQIKKDDSLWEGFAQFIQELSASCKENNLKLRVVLEPLIPFEKLEGIEDVQFVIMCYNLYGSFSGPGPKANKEFLEKVADQSSVLSGTVTMALATGGFDWTDDKVEEISQYQADEQLAGMKIEHDADSQCATGSYTDSSGNQHEVWYADDETISSWKDVLASKGITSFSLWRIGQNNLDTVTAFMK